MDLIPFTPADLGLPDNFESWRPQQQQALALYFDNPHKFTAAAIPTGGGKSGVSLAIGAMNSGRTCVLTSTKGLQDQYVDEAGGTGLIQIKGRANYQCGEQAGRTCEEGAKYRCGSAHSDACPYWSQYQEAKNSKFVVTNYSYFTAIHKYGDGLGSQFDTLILDEAHSAPDEICRAAAIEFTTADIYHTLDFRWPDHQYLESLAAWTSWAKAAVLLATKKLAEYEVVAARGGRASMARQELTEMDNLKHIALRLRAIINRTGDWEVESMRGGYRFEPLWAKDHAEEYLFRFGRRVMLLSATLVPKTLHMLDIAPVDCSYKEFPATFDPRRSPVYLLPSVNLTYESPPGDIQTWLGRGDLVIGNRLDRKGIFMSHSHERARNIVAASEYSRHMITNADRDEGATLLELLDRFRSASPPSTFVSASLTTGYNFPGRECEYVILGKMPYPNSQGRIIKARVKADRTYMDYVASQTLIQECGRGMRYEKDKCEMFAIDNLIGIHLWRKKDFYPGWFRRQVRRVDSIPKAPPRVL